MWAARYFPSSLDFHFPGQFGYTSGDLLAALVLGVLVGWSARLLFGVFRGDS